MSDPSTSNLSRRHALRQVITAAAVGAVGAALAPIAHSEVLPAAGAAFSPSQSESAELLALGKQLDRVMNEIIAAEREPPTDNVVADAVYNSLNMRLAKLVPPILRHTARSCIGLAIQTRAATMACGR